MEPNTRVVVTDIQMRFGSMVAFMVKWTIASIPAMVILLLIVGVIVLVLGTLFGGLFGLLGLGK